MRGSVVFDECGFLDEEMMSVYAAFAIVNKSFKSGKDRDGKSIDRNRLRCIPSNIPNQLFYISAATVPGVNKGSIVSPRIVGLNATSQSICATK